MFGKEKESYSPNQIGKKKAPLSVIQVKEKITKRVAQLKE